MAPDDLTRLETAPRLIFGHYPTPIEELPRLREALGAGPRIFIKRDDYTGPGFGGNKVRKLEYVLARAKNSRADVVITAGGVKSNHARVTAALCAKLGLRCILVLNSAAVAYEGLNPASLYVDEMFGAEIHRVGHRDERAPAMDLIAKRLRADRKSPLVIPLGASIPLGALGFVMAAKEVKAQLDVMNLRVNYLFHSSSSGGTQAGLVAGNSLFNIADYIIGVSSDDTAASISSEVATIIRGIGEMLGLSEGSLDKTVTVLDGYAGTGYGIPTEEGIRATELLARTEGILLDPVYTAKAMAGMIDWIRNGKINKEDNVLFWHTGGQMAMFYVPESAERESGGAGEGERK